MPTINVLDRSGESRSVDAKEGQSLMEVVRDNGFDELLALCGGCCSCATCHVHVDRPHLALLPEMSDDENDLLDSSDHRDETSRLACQIHVTEQLAGMTVRIAQED